MNALATRLSKLENSLGDDDTDRRIRSLTDEELQVEIQALYAKARLCLEGRGVSCTDMSDEDVLDGLAELEKQEASCVDAA